MVKYTRMEENKRVYDAQYDTDEYESLTCECHHLARAKELNGSRRKPFFCIHCKTVYKDKNKLNLHRLEGCLAVTNDGTKTVLKIYPVFGKGQRGEIEDILIKHGLMNPRKKPSRAKRKKSAAALKESSDPSMEVDMAVQEEQTPLRPQKLKVRGMLLSSSSSLEAKKEQHKDSDVHISYGHHEQQQAVDNNTNNNPSSGGSPVVVGPGEMQVQMQLTREQVEAQAREVAHYMQQDASMVSCPEAVPCPGLWHLMQFQLLPSDFPDVKDDSFLQAFFDFVDKGLIDPGLRSSYGTWYMERELQENAGEEEQKAVKLTMSRFKLVQGRPDLFARHMEKSALQAFLQYQKEWVRYEAQMDAVEKELQLRREKYVKDRLDDFDAREHAHKELAVWHWSPLLHLLKSDAIGGVPPKPWLHSDAEQKKIAHAVQVNRMMIVSDPPPCPLIVRMFKIVYLYCFYKNNTLSDPVTGLLRETMLGYSSSESAAPVLQISAQSVLNEGCFLFANLPPFSEGHDDVFRDINSLLHGTIMERENVVQKVQVFLKIVRQRAVGDMAMLHPKEFRVLWCGGDQAEIVDALKMFMHCLKSREDLDMGWVPFPSGHLDHNSVAVMQAREAVLSAIHKLHDQRVLLDKSRMMTASARIDEKFQALVETCVGKSSRRNSVDSGDGSLGKEFDQDEEDSRLERPSSYTTTSGSADSRSSHEMKDTGIDVERPQHLHGEPSRKTFNSSPDLNLNLDSNDSYDPASPILKCDTTLTAHMAGLHVVKPVKTVSVLGVEVQASDPDVSSIPPYPHHFYGPCKDVLQSPLSRVYVPNASVLRPSPSLHADSVHVISSVNNNPGRRSESSCGAETSSASGKGNQALDKYTSRHLFTTQSSFSTTSTANTYNETLRDSSATPVLTVALQDPDEEP